MTAACPGKEDRHDRQNARSVPWPASSCCSRSAWATGSTPGSSSFTAFVGANLLQSAFTELCPAMAIFRRLGLRSAEGAGR